MRYLVIAEIEIEVEAETKDQAEQEALSIPLRHWVDEPVIVEVILLTDPGH